MISGGIIVDLIGAVRYLSQSRGLLEVNLRTHQPGRVTSGSYFILPVAAIFAIVCCGLLVVVLIYS